MGRLSTAKPEPFLFALRAGRSQIGRARPGLRCLKSRGAIWGIFLVGSDADLRWLATSPPPSARPTAVSHRQRAVPGQALPQGGCPGSTGECRSRAELLPRCPAGASTCSGLTGIPRGSGSVRSAVRTSTRLVARTGEGVHRPRGTAGQSCWRPFALAATSPGFQGH
jgi:hypothetical protein